MCVTSLLCGPWAQAQCESLTINTNLVPRVLSYPSLRSEREGEREREREREGERERERERERRVGERTWARSCINTSGFRLRIP